MNLEQDIARVPGSWSSKPPRLLIFRIGYFGDTLIALPAIWALRQAYPDARLIFLGTSDRSGKRVVAHDIFPRAGLIDRYIQYPAADAPLRARLSGLFRAAWEIRRERIDAVIYLAPTRRPLSARRRDVSFFKAMGIKTIIGAEAEPERIYRGADGRLCEVPREADMLMARLRRAGIETRRDASMDLALTTAEHQEAAGWLAAKSDKISPGQPLIAIGPTAGWQSKLWSLDRYAELIRHLVQRHHVFPIIVCGAGDGDVASYLIEATGTGIATLGTLSVRAVGALMSRCRMYVGNDTGAMHLAAAVGVSCVVTMAAIDAPGAWTPLGGPHRCLRAAVPCEGCLLSVCPYENLCLKEISVEQVREACDAMMDSGRAPL